MKKPVVIHPFLLAMFPILFLFAHNAATMSVSQILLPLVVMLGFTFLTMLLLRRILGEGGKAGIVVSVFLVLFFSYGHVFNLAQDWVGSQLGRRFSHSHLLLVWAILLMLYVYLAAKIADPNVWTILLNVVAISLVATSLIRVGGHELRASGINRSSGVGGPEYPATNPVEEGREDAPDIYYIILDRYASSSTLQELFHFDNSEFTDYLTRNGFYIASEARANYPKTFQSLASSLNMKHLTYLTDVLGRHARDQTVVYAMVEDNEVSRFLKSRGYTFIHFGSWWEPTRHNRYADVNFVMGLAEFPMMLYRTTMLDPIGAKLGILDRHQMLQRGILRKFDALTQVPDTDGPKLVFAHVFLPHPPYVFDAQGELLTEQQMQARTAKEGYLGQLAFTNEKLKRLIDQILAESDRPPIIVLQADEGPCACLEEFEGSCGETIDWRQLGDEALSAHMRIFSAYYLPGADYEDILYPSVTPVNSFRIIFDHYFGTDYGLLEDDTYIFEDLRHPYRFINVTGRVEYD